MKSKLVRCVVIQVVMMVFFASAFSLKAYAAEEAEVNVIQPEPWQNELQEIKFEVILPDGKEIKSVEVRPGETGKYINITSTMSLEISYNCDLYFKIKDTENKTYTANGSITCFDTTAPVVSAAIKDTQINIAGQDNESGVNICYINGNEFPMESDILAVQLQAFEANYKEFVIQMSDNVGNVSAAYTLVNPYYATGDDDDISQELPDDGQLSEVGNALGTVTEHSNQNVTVNGASTIYEYDEDGNLVVSDTGKDIYEIQTDTGKVFYLIIDRSQSKDNAILVSAASDNDLLHFTGTDTKVLPQNATAATLVPSTDNEAVVKYVTKSASEEVTEATVSSNANSGKAKETPKTESNIGLYILIGMVVIVVGGIGYYLKIYKPKHSYHPTDDEDEDEDENENYYNEEMA